MFQTPASLLFRLRSPQQPAAWGRLVELYSPLLFHWATRLGHQDSDAADLVQEVFLLLWRKLPEFDYDPSRSFHAWLKTLFLNLARQRHRRRHPIAANFDVSDYPDPAIDAVEAKEYREYLLHRALQLLEKEFTSTHIAAFRDYVIAGTPVDEVAEKLGLSVGMVYTIKSRILNKLRQELTYLLD